MKGIKMKLQRWYEIENDIAFVYNHWNKQLATHCSIVTKDQLKYYRKTFKLTLICD